MLKSLFHILSLTAVLSGMTGTANAHASGTALGIIVGEPTGLCLKHWNGPASAIDGAMAWSFSNNYAALHVHADYLIHKFNLVEDINMHFHYGLGMRVKLESSSRVGLRIPLGLDFPISNTPLDLFLELAPLLDLVPATGFNLNAAFGIRFYLNQ